MRLARDVRGWLLLSLNPRKVDEIADGETVMVLDNANTKRVKECKTASAAKGAA